MPTVYLITSTLNTKNRTIIWKYITNVLMFFMALTLVCIAGDCVWVKMPQFINALREHEIMSHFSVFSYLCPCSTKPVISSTGIFVAIDNNTLFESKV